MKAFQAVAYHFSQLTTYHFSNGVTENFIHWTCTSRHLISRLPPSLFQEMCLKGATPPIFLVVFLLRTQTILLFRVFHDAATKDSTLSHGCCNQSHRSNCIYNELKETCFKKCVYHFSFYKTSVTFMSSTACQGKVSHKKHKAEYAASFLFYFLESQLPCSDKTWIHGNIADWISSHVYTSKSNIEIGMATVLVKIHHT
jgi:hypothetical protein